MPFQPGRRYAETTISNDCSRSFRVNASRESTVSALNSRLDSSRARRHKSTSFGSCSTMSNRSGLDEEEASFKMVSCIASFAPQRQHSKLPGFHILQAAAPNSPKHFHRFTRMRVPETLVPLTIATVPGEGIETPPRFGTVSSGWGQAWNESGAAGAPQSGLDPRHRSICAASNCCQPQRRNHRSFPVSEAAGKLQLSYRLNS